MPGSYDKIVEIIASVCSIEKEKIKAGSHIFSDLEIDSLDFLDVVYDIDKAFNIKLPVEEWVAAAEEGDPDIERFFVVDVLARYVDEELAKNKR